MQLRGDRMPFGGRAQRSSLWRILVLLALIAGGVMLTRMVEAGRVKPLFLPTPTPTRIAISYREEGQAHFAAGDLSNAIAAYQEALDRDANNAELWAELARIQVYSSALLATPEERRNRLAQARQSIDTAVELEEELVGAWAIRILVYDWSATAVEDPVQRQEFFTIAETSRATANRLDPNNALAIAFEAELQVDTQNFAPALDKAQQAIALEPDSMDVHRVYGSVLESYGLYRQAIEEYLKAVEINPNLTFLHLRIGSNYRRLRDVDNALAFFEQAAKINEQNQVKDPIPYLAIGRTYLQEGQFFIAARNLEQAVAIAPSNPELFGFLGVIYFKARNYETAEEVLRCAVDGCGPEVGRRLLCQKVYGCDPDDVEDLEAQQYGETVAPLPLESDSLEYYYTYGSVLAYNKQCEDAERVFDQLMARYGEDPIVAAIVDSGRDLCLQPSAPQPEATANPEARRPSTSESG